MLIGQFTHKIDEKNRLSLPARFRKEIGKQVVITHGLDGCLFVYSTKEWQQFSEKLSSLSMGQADTRAFNRFLLSSAIETQVDASGRILIPDFLRSYAKITDQVIVAGVYNRIELWNEKAWNKYTEQVTKKADQLAEKLGDIGMI